MKDDLRAIRLISYSKALVVLVGSPDICAICPSFLKSTLNDRLSFSQREAIRSATLDRRQV
jgi:hypothetical protein